MGRVPFRVVDPAQPLSIVEAVVDVTKVVDTNIEFGNPSHPEDHLSVLAAGVTNTSHNGLTQNIKGSWVELKFEAADTATTAYHNLFQDEPLYVVPVTGAPNVRWLVFGISHDGTQQTYWNDLQAPGNSGHIGPANGPTFTNMSVAPFDTLDLYWFTNLAEEELYFEVQMPHDWKEGTNIEPHVHWTPEISAAANECVQWGLEYSWANVGGSFGASTTIYNDATDDTTATIQGVTVVASDHYISAIDKTAVGGAATIDGTGKTLSSMLVCRLFRDITDSGPQVDDYADEAGLLELDFHYESDGSGTETTFTKAALDQENAAPAVVFIENDTVAANSIDLRLRAGPGMKISSANPVTVSLFFVQAARGMLETAS